MRNQIEGALCATAIVLAGCGARTAGREVSDTRVANADDHAAPSASDSDASTGSAGQSTPHSGTSVEVASNSAASNSDASDAASRSTSNSDVPGAASSSTSNGDTSNSGALSGNAALGSMSESAMDSGALDGGSDTPGIADAGGDAAFAVRAIQCGEQQDGSGSEPLGSGEAWYARIRGPESQVSHTFAIDTEGSILVAGSSRDAVDFGESLASDAGQSPSVDGIFIAKYTKQGELTWVKQYAATQPIITSIVTDGTDIALVGQYTTSALQIGGTVLPEPKPIETRVFVARFDAEGTPLFAQSLTPAGLEIAGLVTVLQDHSLLVARYAGEGDIWLTKLAQDGAIVDDRAVARVPDDGTSMPPFSDLAVDSDGNVFLTGFFAGTANFGAGPVHATTDPDLPPIINRGIFVAKYAATDGSLIWEQHYGASSSDSTAGGYSLLPIDDDVVVAGAFEYGHTNLGSGNLEEAECPRLLATDPLDGESDGTFVARLSGASGELQWSIVLPSGRSFGAKLTRDPVGDIALLAIVRNADATSFAEVYSASTGAFVRGRILPELGGGVTSANGRMTLDADGQVVTATAFWGSLGGFESEGYEDILVARFPL